MGFLQDMPAILYLDSGLVTGGGGLAAQLLGSLKKTFKFQITVALDTGVRCCFAAFLSMTVFAGTAFREVLRVISDTLPVIVVFHRRPDSLLRQDGAV